MNRILSGTALLFGSLLLAAPSSAAAARARASSVVEDEAGKHPAEAAFDGLLKEGWGEGRDGYGEGEWLELDLGKATPLQSLSIWPGNLSQGKKSYREYSRPRLVTILIDGEPLGEPIRLQDEMQRLDIPLGTSGRRIKVQVDEVFEGFVFSDMYIAEVCVNYLENHGDTDDRLQQWLSTMGGEVAQEAFESTLKDKYQAHKDAEFGDKDAFAWIMDCAGDGAPFLREQVKKLVPLGSRAIYIQPDEMALSALRKLKDANGIPAIEMAALRAVGHERDALDELVEIFYAYQALIGGPDANVPYWGKTGWAEGAIQSFGEPIPVAVDRYGAVYVADVGNNRVQRFAENGRPDRVWGGATDITNAWFDRGRPWYVSGARPGEESGYFHNPVDVELIPGKESDGFAVLDAKGRVQLFDPDGNPQIGWTIRSKQEIEPGLGGEAYLAWVPKHKLLYVFWGHEAIGYNPLGEEQARWEVPDGTPNAVVVDKKSKFLLAYRDEIIKYDLDGFRHGKVMDEASLAPGFEDVDMAIDEKGKLWVLIDTGLVFKFKKPGKLDYSVQVTDYSLEKPRFSVREDMLYICERDRIMRLDALQLQLDQEEAAREAAEEGASK